jgi:hypothetical protein
LPPVYCTIYARDAPEFFPARFSSLGNISDRKSSSFCQNWIIKGLLPPIAQLKDSFANISWERSLFFGTMDSGHKDMVNDQKKNR